MTRFENKMIRYEKKMIKFENKIEQLGNRLNNSILNLNKNLGKQQDAKDISSPIEFRHLKHLGMEDAVNFYHKIRISYLF